MKGLSLSEPLYSPVDREDVVFQFSLIMNSTIEINAFLKVQVGPQNPEPLRQYYATDIRRICPCRYRKVDDVKWVGKTKMGPGLALTGACVAHHRMNARWHEPFLAKDNI